MLPCSWLAGRAGWDGVSMETRSELVAAISGRYARSRRDEKARILDEFVAVTGFHRKHAMRLLRSGGPTAAAGPRPGRSGADGSAGGLGGVRPGLRQAASGDPAGAGRGAGAAGTPCARCRSASTPAGDERGNDRPRLAGCQGRWQAEPPAARTTDDPAERSDPDVLRLGRPTAGVRRGGSGRAERASVGRQLRARAWC
jgi:hypothetical protein